MTLRNKKGWLLYIPVIIVALTGFFFFDQAFDMKISMTHASELITGVLNGEWFYERTYQHAIAEGYLWRSAELSGAIYNIVIYITMAIWALPLYIISHVFQFPPHRYTELLNMWGRIMVILVSLVAANQIGKLHRELNPMRKEKESSVDIRYLFLASPILLFSVIVFNQYDIFSVLTTIIALRMYYKDRKNAFCLVMALSICYKLFAILIFVPFLLLREKRISRLIGYFSLGVSLYVVTTAFSAIFDPGYLPTQEMMGKIYNYGDWVFEAQLPGGFSNVSIFILAYIILCFIAYMRHEDSAESRQRENHVALWFGCAAYMLFFAFVRWHPQWFVILVPFLVLLITEVNHNEVILIIETLINAGFIFLCTMTYSGISIVGETLYVRLFSPPIVGNYNILRALCNQYGIGNTFFMTVLVAGMIVFLYAMWKSIHGKKISSATQESNMIRTILISGRSCILFIYTLPPIIHMLFA